MSIYATWLSIDADDHDPKCARWVKADGTGKPGVDWHRHDIGDVRLRLAGGVGGEGDGIDVGGEYWRLAEGVACTCRCGPIVYQGSHIFPSDDDPRDGVLLLCTIPGFLTREGYDDEHEHGETVQPWLRLTLNEECVLLDLKQVNEIHETLGDWLGRIRP